MPIKDNGNLPEILRERLKDWPRRQKAMRAALQKAFRFHKFMGVPIVVWQDGKVVEIPPEEIQLDNELNGQSQTNGK